MEQAGIERLKTLRGPLLGIWGKEDQGIAYPRRRSETSWDQTKKFLEPSLRK